MIQWKTMVLKKIMWQSLERRFAQDRTVAVSATGVGQRPVVTAPVAEAATVRSWSVHSPAYSRLCHIILKKYFSCAVVCVTFLVGCERSVPLRPGYYYSDNVKTFDQMQSGDCVVRVNGRALTKSDWIDLYMYKERLANLADGVQDSGSFDEGKFAKCCGSVMVDMIRRELFRQYAKAKNFVPSDESVVAEQASLMNSLKKYNTLSFEGLCAAFGDNSGKFLLAAPFEAARDRLLRQSVTTNDLTKVSEAEIAARCKYVEEFDANADRLNEKARAKLLAAREEILRGSDFDKVTSRVAEVAPEDGTKWCTVELGELPADEDLAKWLPSAKVGDISAPIDLEDGLAIIKVLDIGLGEAPQGCKRPKTWTLVKCTVRAFEHMRYQDRRQMERQLLYWKNQEANKALCVKLFAEAVVEYPNGTNFFPNAIY